jgi:hypothetical protein
LRVCGPALIDAQKKIEFERNRMHDIAEGRLIYGWLEGALKDVGALPRDQSLEELIAKFSG